MDDVTPASYFFYRLDFETLNLICLRVPAFSADRVRQRCLSHQNFRMLRPVDAELHVEQRKK